MVIELVVLTYLQKDIAIVNQIVFRQKGNVACFVVCRYCFSSKITPRNTNTIRVTDRLDLDRNVGPDLGPNCLQRLSADDSDR